MGMSQSIPPEVAAQMAQRASQQGMGQAQAAQGGMTGSQIGQGASQEETNKWLSNLNSSAASGNPQAQRMQQMYASMGNFGQAQAAQGGMGQPVQGGQQLVQGGNMGTAIPQEFFNKWQQQNATQPSGQSVPNPTTNQATIDAMRQEVARSRAAGGVGQKGGQPPSPQQLGQGLQQQAMMQGQMPYRGASASQMFGMQAPQQQGQMPNQRQAQGRVPPQLPMRGRR